VKQIPIEIQVVFEKQEYLLLFGRTAKNAPQELVVSFERVPSGRVVELDRESALPVSGRKIRNGSLTNLIASAARGHVRVQFEHPGDPATFL
jgi:hypothetical protein